MRRFCGSAPAGRGAAAKIDAALGSTAERAKGRSASEQAALIKSLSHEFSGVPPPPAGSEEWPVSLVRRWHQDGGALRLAALAAEPPETQRRLVDDVGSTLRQIVVEPHQSPTIMEALDAGNSSFLDAVAGNIRRDHFVTCRLGLDAATLDAAASEGEDAQPLMRPGEIRGVSPDAEAFLVGGASPSGAARGDSYLYYGELGTRASTAFPALTKAHTALSAVTDALAPRLPELEIGASSDTFIARFPGDGLGYGAHYDNGVEGLGRLTAILYTTRNWTPEHGGELLLLDPQERAWWAVEPEADTLILFKSEKFLHKVKPVYKPRVALTAFLSKLPSKS